ncbi:hypothetical protein EYC84_000374 [Monilinia fructicola]|uniref:Uncharacterized protein n=1 Tax=Monilinia fructicola TaxID=38448 RepID=A0A5M9JW13_MONFR|nr:hypothetical protein EYC84_000374 [Monilinia fructicola]
MYGDHTKLEILIEVECLQRTLKNEGYKGKVRGPEGYVCAHRSIFHLKVTWRHYCLPHLSRQSMRSSNYPPCMLIAMTVFSLERCVLTKNRTISSTPQFMIFLRSIDAKCTPPAMTTWLFA